MNEIYTRITELCKQKDVSGYRMCKDLKIQPSLLTDLKAGRQSSMSYKKASRIAEYFGISVQYLLTGSDEEQEEDIDRTPTVVVSAYEKKLLECWRRSTDDEKETIFTVLKKYGLPYPQEEIEQSHSASSTKKVG